MSQSVDMGNLSHLLQGEMGEDPKDKKAPRSNKDCLIIIGTLILLSLFAVNFHDFNSEPGKV